jgi:hypothetical protein
MKKIIPLITLCICTIGLYSQETYTAFGFRGAIGASTFKGMDKYESTNRIPGTNITTIGSYKSGIFPAWDLGLTVQHGRNNFMIQGDLTTSYYNTNLNNAYISETSKIKRIRLYYTNIALNFGAKHILNNDLRLVMGLGPYIGFDPFSWLSSRERTYSKKLNGNTSSIIYDDVLDGEDTDFKTFDFGGSILIGIEYRNLQFALNYYHGLYNIVDDEFPLYNRAVKASVVYFF